MRKCILVPNMGKVRRNLENGAVWSGSLKVIENAPIQ